MPPLPLHEPGAFISFFTKYDPDFYRKQESLCDRYVPWLYSY